MPNALRRACRMHMDRRRAVRREGQGGRLTQTVDDEQAGDPLAARRVGLQHVGSACIDERRERIRRVAILADRDLHACWCAIAAQAKSLEIAMVDRLLEPGDL